MKLLEENGEIFIGFGNDFLVTTSKHNNKNINWTIQKFLSFMHQRMPSRAKTARGEGGNVCTPRIWWFVPRLQGYNSTTKPNRKRTPPFLQRSANP